MILSTDIGTVLYIGSMIPKLGGLMPMTIANVLKSVCITCKIIRNNKRILHTKVNRFLTAKIASKKGYNSQKPLQCKYLEKNWIMGRNYIENGVVIRVKVL